MSIRMILLHDMQESILTDIPRQPPHDLYALVLLPRHNQMPDKDPSLRNSIRSECQIAHLLMHRLDTFHCHAGIIIRLQQSLTRLWPPDLKVRQIDIDQPIHQLQAL